MKIGLTLSVIVCAFSVISMSCKDCKTCDIHLWSQVDTLPAMKTVTTEEFCNTNLENVESNGDSLSAFVDVTHDGDVYIKWYDCK